MKWKGRPGTHPQSRTPQDGCPRPQGPWGQGKSLSAAAGKTRSTPLTLVGMPALAALSRPATAALLETTTTMRAALPGSWVLSMRAWRFDPAEEGNTRKLTLLKETEVPFKNRKFSITASIKYYFVGGSGLQCSVRQSQTLQMILGGKLGPHLAPCRVSTALLTPLAVSAGFVCVWGGQGGGRGGRAFLQRCSKEEAASHLFQKLRQPLSPFLVGQRRHCSLRRSSTPVHLHAWLPSGA